MREQIRKLTPAEWSVLEPHLQRRLEARLDLQRAIDAAQTASLAAVAAERAVADMVALLAGGERETAHLDVARRELFRTVALDG